MNCANCTFSRVNEYDDGSFGLRCHRFPPQLFVEADGRVAQANPDVSNMMWCGEWEGA
jgi:hypothetical protein